MVASIRDARDDDACSMSGRHGALKPSFALLPASWPRHRAARAERSSGGIDVSRWLRPGLRWHGHARCSGAARESRRLGHTDSKLLSRPATELENFRLEPKGVHVQDIRRDNGSVLSA